ncbi:hypothetical protein ACU5JM_04750 [Rhodococcus erythropolis]|uniref:hypothetical protein n=1 Tax=Rhodococcus erythropolis TaxID=1833 RepID=UPI00406BCDAE
MGSGPLTPGGSPDPRFTSVVIGALPQATEPPGRWRVTRGLPQPAVDREVQTYGIGVAFGLSARRGVKVASREEAFRLELSGPNRVTVEPLLLRVLGPARMELQLGV